MSRDVPVVESDDDFDDLEGFSLVRTPAPWGVVAVGLVLCVLGLAVATYLTVEHFSSHPSLAACPESSHINCAKVTESQYSKVFGIPVVFFGLVFFVVMAGLVATWRSSLPQLRLARLAWASVGLLSVFYLVYAEAAKLAAICLYCTSVHVMTFILFAMIVYVDAVRGPTLVEDD